LQRDAPQDLYYSSEHTWAKKEANGTAKVGITKYGVDNLKDLALIQVMPVGSKVSQMTSIAVVESIKAVSAVITPISGVIKAVNEALISEPWQANYDTYGQGWIVVLEPSDWEAEAKMLLTSADYQRLIAEKK
jgi:glycine cleavage system H protein